MGVIWDIVKDIPQAAVLKERVVDFERKLTEAETQVSLLNIDLRKAESKINQLETENERLKQQIDAAAHTEPTIDKIAHDILALFGKHSDKEISREWIVRSLGGDMNTVTYYFDDLKENKYIESGGFTQGEEVPYRLTQKGRKYLLEHS